MDQYDRSRNQISPSSAAAQPPFPSSFLTSNPYSGEPPRVALIHDAPRQEEQQDQNIIIMRGAKRKRLAKACDACHKSKRRCDGTAPCSNCFFASKQCTYTDASGRPVPAPHKFDPVRGSNLPSSSDNRASSFNQPQSSQPLNSGDPSRFQHSHRLPYVPNSGAPPSLPGLGNDPNDDDRKSSRKRFRNERGNAIAPEDLIIDGPVIGITMDRPAPVELDHGLTRELTNLFFTHCHPARAIIHKPTFAASLSHNRVPSYLLHAVCALAAPLSKQPRIRTTPSRYAGKPFAQEALSLMFDGAGRLVCEPNLAAAQALCLLQMHDILTKESNVCWGSRYHDLALRIVEALGVHSPEHPTLTPVPSPEFIQASLEREAIRRIFWYIHLIDVTASIYFKKPITFTEAELRLRLPVDETSFELGVHSTLPEYIYLPAVRTLYASEFGHLIRIITIYAKVELILDELNVPYQDANSFENTNKMLTEAEQQMENWARTLPEHLRFSEQSLQVQQSMFETSSNTGAWCWCCLHVYHASCALAVNCGRQRGQRDPKVEPQWALSMVDSILRMIGDRAKNSLLLGAALWSLIKYCKRDDPQVRAWSGDYEESFGTRMFELVQEWRPQPSPPQRHLFSIQPQQQPAPPSQPQQQLQRLSDTRHPGSVTIHTTRPPPLQHGGDASHNNRRSPSASPNAYLRGRYVDDMPPQNTSSINSTRLSAHNLSDGRDARSGPTLPLPGSVPAGISPTAHGGHGDQKFSMKEDSNIHRGNNEPSGETPGLINGPILNGATQGNGRPGGSPPNSGAPSGALSVAGGSRNLSIGEGSQSLPSLKASGLLDWNASRLEVQKQAHGPNGPQRSSSPRRSPPLLALHQDSVENRTTATLGMPVGLQWLANETR